MSQVLHDYLAQPSGPYIVTTKRLAPYYRDLPPEVLSRCAVATLNEANAIIARVTRVAGLCDVPEAGGTVGPLRDGTVIEVETTTWQVLWHVSDLDAEELAGALGGIEACQQRILDAYNARQESA